MCDEHTLALFVSNRRFDDNRSELPTKKLCLA